MGLPALPMGPAVAEDRFRDCIVVNRPVKSTCSGNKTKREPAHPVQTTGGENKSRPILIISGAVWCGLAAVRCDQLHGAVALRDSTVKK